MSNNGINRKLLALIIFTITTIIVVSTIIYWFFPVNVNLLLVTKRYSTKASGTWWLIVDNTDMSILREYNIELPPLDNCYAYLICSGRPIKKLTYQRYSKIELAEHYYNDMYIGRVIYGGDIEENIIYVYRLNRLPLIDKSDTDY